VAKASYHAAKDTFRWRFLVRQLQELPLETLKDQALRSVSSRHGLGAAGWAILTTGTVALLYWNGRLVLATGAGVAVMLLVYLMHDWKPDLNLSEVRKFLHGWNQPFVVSAGAGAAATLTTYLAASVWADAHSAWIASAALLQGAGTLAVLVLLVWQMLNRQTNRDRAYFNQFLLDLAHEDPLKRLLAVRHLTDSVSVLQDDLTARRRGPGKKLSRREVADYFRLMLVREADPIVREAVLDGLQTLDIVHQLKAATAPPIELAPQRGWSSSEQPVQKALPVRSRRRVPAR
jgi:hypothetical protein